MRKAQILGSVFLISCGTEQRGSRFFSADTKQAELAVSFPALSGEDTQNLVNIILPSGERKVVSEKVSGLSELAVPLLPEFLHSTTPKLWSEEFAALGQSLPKRLFEGDLSQDPAGVIFVELVSGFSPGKVQLASFGRYEFPISRRELFSDAKSVTLSTKSAPWKPSLKAGIVPVKVTDIEGNPLEGVQVLAINRDLSESQDKSKSGIPIWKLPGYQPLLSKTDAQGAAWVGPLFQNAKTPQFQVLASAKGYCPFAQAAQEFNSKIQGVVEIKIKKCSVTSKTPKVDVRLSSDLKFNSVEKTWFSKTQKVYLTNASKVSFEIDSLSNALRPLEILVHEIKGGNTKEKWEAFKDPGVGTFRSQLSLELPEKFSAGGVNGDYSVTISLLGSSDEGSLESDRIQTFVFYFSKSLSSVIFDLATENADTFVWSQAGSDAEGALKDSIEASREFFEIRSAQCGPGVSFAAISGTTDAAFKQKIFVPCENGIVKYPYANLQHTSALPTQQVNFYLKDAYGNVSESTGGKNKKSINFFD